MQQHMVWADVVAVISYKVAKENPASMLIENPYAAAARP
jgi:hypothetical protein